MFSPVNPNSITPIRFYNSIQIQSWYIIPRNPLFLFLFECISDVLYIHLKHPNMG